jgi:hypothetical protein
VGLGLIFGPIRLAGPACAAPHPVLPHCSWAGPLAPPAPHPRRSRPFRQRRPRAGRACRVVAGVRSRSPRAPGWPPPLRGLVKAQEQLTFFLSSFPFARLLFPSSSERASSTLSIAAAPPPQSAAAAPPFFDSPQLRLRPGFLYLLRTLPVAIIEGKGQCGHFLSPLAGVRFRAGEPLRATLLLPLASNRPASTSRSSRTMDAGMRHGCRHAHSGEPLGQSVAPFGAARRAEHAGAHSSTTNLAVGDFRPAMLLPCLLSG